MRMPHAKIRGGRPKHRRERSRFHTRPVTSMNSPEPVIPVLMANRAPVDRWRHGLEGAVGYSREAAISHRFERSPV